MLPSVMAKKSFAILVPGCPSKQYHDGGIICKGIWHGIPKPWLLEICHSVWVQYLRQKISCNMIDLKLASINTWDPIKFKWMQPRLFYNGHLPYTSDFIVNMTLQLSFIIVIYYIKTTYSTQLKVLYSDFLLDGFQNKVNMIWTQNFQPKQAMLIMSIVVLCRKFPLLNCILIQPF